MMNHREEEGEGEEAGQREREREKGEDRICTAQGGEEEATRQKWVDDLPHL